MALDLAIALLLSCVALLVSVQQGLPLMIPLVVALVVMTGLYWRRGMALPHLIRLMRQGAAQSISILTILLLIGAVMASWLLSGTVPALVYYGLQLLHPRWFLVSAFLLTGGLSILIGTSFGTTGTLGLALMIVARSSGIDEHWAAGAIIAGVYVGDRCSPMSSGTHLVATITKTDLYRNLRHMIVTSWAAFAVSVGIYAIASWVRPVTTVDSALMTAIPDQFFIHPLTLLPAAIVIVLTLRRVSARQTLLLSLASAVAIALLFQSASIQELGLVLLRGLELPSSHPLHTVFRGGGLLRMVQVCGIVLASTALSGLLSGTGTFDPWENWLRRWPGQRGLFGGTVLTGLMTSAFGCTQTIAIMLTQTITRPLYTASALSPEQHAVDLENSAVVLAPLIPWNIAGLVPATILLTDPGFIPYAFYLYLLPLLNWLWRKQSLLKPSVLATTTRPLDPADPVLVTSHASTPSHQPPER